MTDGSWRDFSGSNYIPMLLEEREKLKTEISKRERRLKTVNNTIKELLGDATAADCPGWHMEIRTRYRPQYTVSAQTIKSLIAERVPEDEETNDEE